MSTVTDCSTWMTGTGSGRGSCGELVQGILSDGRHFHVTCPINRSATVSLRAWPSRSWSFQGPAGESEKLRRAIELTAEFLDLGPLTVRIARRSDLEVGKGMGSSTADIVAGARAMAAAAGKDLSSRELAAIATRIEVSDGTMFDAVVAFEQTGEFIVREFPWWPQFDILMVIPPATFRTESANFAGKQRYATDFQRMMDELDAASVAKRGDVFAMIATESARLNQDFVLNPLLDVLLNKSKDLGADGVIVGHTGTISGLLYLTSEDDAGVESRVRSIDKANQAVPRLARLLAPGIRLELTTSLPCHTEASP